MYRKPTRRPGLFIRFLLSGAATALFFAFTFLMILLYGVIGTRNSDLRADLRETQRQADIIEAEQRRLGEALEAYEPLAVPEDKGDQPA